LRELQYVKNILAQVKQILFFRYNKEEMTGIILQFYLDDLLARLDLKIRPSSSSLPHLSQYPYRKLVTILVRIYHRQMIIK